MRPVQRRFVVGHQVITTDRQPNGANGYARLSVKVGNRSVWTSDEPVWRELGFGVHGQGAFLWSARRVLALPDGPEGAAVSFEIDEDILAVLFVPGGWILVCETSVRGWHLGQESNRIELFDTVADVGWLDEAHLLVVDDRGSRTTILAQSASISLDLT